MLDPTSLGNRLVDGRYRLRDFLGSGAFGSVYSAEEIAMGEVIGEVAIKLISPQNDRHRLDVLHELRAMSRLSHPNLLSYRSAGEWLLAGGESVIYLATELAEGTLEDHLKNCRLSVAETAVFTRELAAALSYLAQETIVHRDLKPANVLRRGTAWKVADFGLARVAPPGQQLRTGAAGTLIYMSPEAIDGEVIAAGDVWALGVLLQESLTGRFPYSPDSQLQFIRQVASAEPFIAPGIPQPLDAIVRGCLVKDPKQRWTAQQVLDALDQKPLQHQTQLPVAVAPVAPSPMRQHDTQILARRDDETIVSAAGDGDFRTIGEAIAAATAGARLWILPGIYRESLLIEKPIEINGEGARDQIIIESIAGNCLKVRLPPETTAHVRGLTLVNGAGKVGKRLFGVSVKAGELVMEDCVLHCDTLACLAVQGAEAKATLRGCLIAGGSSDGVLFSDNARGILENCQISGHARHGVHIKKFGEPILQSCSIVQNGGSGVCFVEGGRGTLENCEIAANRKTGVLIGAGCEPILRKCRVFSNQQQAICIERGAAGQVEECDLSGNKFGAWDMSSGTLVVRRQNKEA